MPSRSYEKDNFAQMDVTIEISPDIIDMKRQGYDLLQFLSDIGGIQALLMSGFAFFVSIWNYNMFDNYLVGRLYKLGHTSNDNTKVKGTFKESDFMKSRRFYNPKEYFRDMLPWVFFCKSCKADRLEKGFQ